jgi:hypothetical protein
MNLEPPSNVNNKRTVSERLSAGLDFFNDLDLLFQLIAILVGLGCLGYVVTSWTQYFVQNGDYLIGLSIGGTGLLLGGAALLRIPIALVGVFGGAAICATAFLGGMINVLLP